MALALANRVQETGTANTTVSFTLTGAVGGFQSFAAVGNTNTTYYAATDASGNWEVGLGTYSTTGPTLTRTTIYASSNAGSAVTFVGGVTVFLTYPSGRSVNLDASGNASALGTITSGTWNASTIPVAYGGTGVTVSSGASSVMLRDANQNVSINRLNQSNTSTAAAGATTALTAASSYSQTLTGTGNQTYTMPDATTLTTGVAFVFNNNSTGVLTLKDYAAATIGTITAGGAVELVLLANGTTAGTWDVHGYLPENVTWGTNALNLGSTVITGGTWNGGTIPTGYGGTGLTTFTAANNALYSTSGSALAAGTLPVAAGGTGASSAGITAFNNITGYSAAGATGTTSTNLVFSTSPTITTPTINQITSASATALTLQSAGTTAITVDTSQNVGIGTSSPNYQFQSYKSGAVANYLQVTSGATGTGAANGTLFGVDASGNGIVNVQGAVNYITSVAGAERMRIDSSGNVGIGATPYTNAWNKLNAYGANSATTFSSQLPAITTLKNTDTTAGTFTLIGIADPLGDTNTVAFGGVNVTPSATSTSSVGAFIVATKASGSSTVTERMRITSAGGVSFGATGTAYGTSGQVLQSNGNAAPTWTTSISGSAATLTTARAIYGNNFDGSAALTQIIASTYGGTGNGFTKFSGPATAEKTFTLPDATCSILTSNAAVTVAQGGTGQTSYTDGQLLIGNTTGNTLAKATLTAGTAIGVSNGSGAITISNTGVTSNVAGTGISVSGATGAVTITNSGVTSNVAGTGVTVSGATGAVTVSIGQAVATSSNVQFNSLGVGTAGSATAGEIRATNNITAYYSDIRLKTKVGDITSPLDKVRQIETMLYHANETAVELGYDASIIEVGLSAQSVQAVQPEAVAPAPIDDKYLTVRYERLVPLLLESVKALEDRIIELEAKLKG